MERQKLVEALRQSRWGEGETNEVDEELELLVVDVDVVEAVVLGRVASRSRRCRRSPAGVVVSRSGSRRRNW